MTKVFVSCVVIAALHTASTIDKEVFEKPYLTNVSFSCVQVEQKGTNIALLIPILLLNKAFFGLGGLEFCQKMQIGILSLVMLKTHFGQNLKYLHLKCVSCGVL